LQGRSHVLRIPLREAFFAKPGVNRLNPAIVDKIAVIEREGDDQVVGVLVGQEVGGDGRRQLVDRDFDDIQRRAGSASKAGRQK
jgi:hypothetical protein